MKFLQPFKLKQFIKKNSNFFVIFFQILFWSGMIYFMFNRSENVSFGILIYLICIGLSIPILIIYFLTKNIYTEYFESKNRFNNKPKGLIIFYKVIVGIISLLIGVGLYIIGSYLVNIMNEQYHIL